MSTSKTFLAATVAALLGSSGVAPSDAQIGPGPDNPAQPGTSADRTDDRSYGWIGAFGLLGLLGLVGARNRTTEREHDFAGGRSTDVTPTQR